MNSWHLAMIVFSMMIVLSWPPGGGGMFSLCSLFEDRLGELDALVLSTPAAAAAAAVARPPSSCKTQRETMAAARLSVEGKQQLRVNS